MADHKKDEKKEHKEKKEDKPKKEKKDKRNVVFFGGASGNTGSAALKTFLSLPKAKKYTIRVGSRDPEKAKAKLGVEGVEFVKFDTADPASLAAAFAGVKTALLVLPSTPGKRGAELVQQAEAAFAAGVEYVVSITALVILDPTSVFGKAMNPYAVFRDGPHKANIVDIRPNFFIENFWGQKDAIVGQNQFYINLPKGSYAHLSTNDIGAFAAHILVKPKKYGGQNFNLSGPKLENLQQLSEAISAGLGRTVTGVAVPHEAVVAALTPFIGAENAEGSAELNDLIDSGKFDQVQNESVASQTFEQIVGRPRVSTEQWFKNLAAVFSKAP